MTDNSDPVDKGLVERLRCEGAKLATCKPDRKSGMVTMTVESARLLARDFGQAITEITALRKRVEVLGGVIFRIGDPSNASEADAKIIDEIAQAEFSRIEDGLDEARQALEATR
jgi:hypothetical protein